jgi:hypothetical protein
VLEASFMLGGGGLEASAAPPNLDKLYQYLLLLTAWHFKPPWYSVGSFGAQITLAWRLCRKILCSQTLT